MRFLVLWACVVASVTGANLRLLLLTPTTPDGVSNVFGIGEWPTAAYLAVDTVNNDPNLLVGFNLTVDVRDTALGSEPVTLEAVHSVVHDPELAGIIGPIFSAAIPAPAMLASLYNIPMIAPYADRATEVNKAKFPYLWRAYPSIKPAMEGMVAVFQHFGWQNIAVVSGGDDGRQERILLQEACEDIISIRTTLQFAEGITIQGAAYVVGALQESGCRVFLYLGNTAADIRVIHEASHRAGLDGEGYVWFTTESRLADVPDWNGLFSVTQKQVSTTALSSTILKAWSTTEYNESTVGRRNWDDGDQLPNLYATGLWDVFMMYAHVLNETVANGGDPTDGAAVRPYLSAVRYVKERGAVLSFGPDQDLVAEMQLTQQQDGETMPLGDTSTTMSLTHSVYWGNLSKNPGDGSDVDAKKSEARGIGLLAGEAFTKAVFTVQFFNSFLEPMATTGSVVCTVEGPTTPVPCHFLSNGSGTYVPIEGGLHSLSIRINSQHITGSPFHPYIDIDACIDGKCDVHAVCTDAPRPALGPPDGRTCTCLHGYEGTGEPGHCRESGRPAGQIIIVVLAFIVVMVVVACAGFMLLRHNSNKYDTMRINEDDIVLAEKIGAGSFGEVYKGTFRGSEVAVKKMLKTSAQQERELMREATVMCQLRHPNCVLYMGCVLSAHGGVLLVTELLERGSVFNVLHNVDVELSYEARISILTDAAKGMAYLHEAEPPIIHRDLKTLNLLISQAWVTKVADFGMSGSIATGETQFGSVCWAAPELLAKKSRSTLACDVYSYGVICSEVLTRTLPFDGLANYVVMQRVVAKKLTPALPAALDPDLLELFSNCAAYNPQERPTFSAILKSLKPHILMPTPKDMISLGSLDVKPFLSSLPPSGATSTVVSFDVVGMEDLWESAPRAAHTICTTLDHIVSLVVADCHAGTLHAEEDTKTLAFGNADDCIDFVLRLQKETIAHSWADMDAFPIAEADGRRVLPLRFGVASGILTNNYTSQSSYCEDISQETVVAVAMELRDLANIGQVVSTAEAVSASSEWTCQVNELGPHMVANTEMSLFQISSGAKSAPVIKKLTSRKRRTRPSRHELSYEDFVTDPVRIGVGTLGMTYRGSWKNVPVVVKQPRRKQFGFLDRLEVKRDTAVLRSLDHPNVVKLIGCVWDPQLFLVLEYADQGCLAAYLEKTTMSVLTSTRVLLDVARGCDFLNARGIVHGKVTVGNVLLFSDASDRLTGKITDFAFSLLRKSSLGSATDERFLWVAPEVLQGEAPTELSDVYSFGWVIWEVFSKDEAFKGMIGTQTIIATIEGTRPPLPHAFPPSLKGLIGSCWSGEKFARPQFSSIIMTLETQCTE